MLSSRSKRFLYNHKTKGEEEKKATRENISFYCHTLDGIEKKRERAQVGWKKFSAFLRL